MPAKKKKKSARRSPKTAPRKGAGRKRASRRPSLASALAEAIWTDADEALAEALLELDQLQSAKDEAGREAATTLLAQALARTARKRGLSRIGALGARVAFDPEEHELDALGRKPSTVRIVARGVARGEEVLRRPRVSPARRKGTR